MGRMRPPRLRAGAVAHGPVQVLKSINGVRVVYDLHECVEVSSIAAKKPLSALEITALETLAKDDGMLISQLPDHTSISGVFGRIPGLPIYQKLVKRGLALITDEEPVVWDDGSVYHPTPGIYITEDGLAAYRKLSSAKQPIRATHRATRRR